MKTAFKSLIRFEDTEGIVRYGEVSDNLNDFEGRKVSIYDGNQPWNLQKSSAVATVAKVLCPLSSTPIIYGIGLNYKTHLEETGFPTPKFPVYFSKPPDALTGPYQDINIPKCAKNLDWEGELCFVVGRDCKDLDDNHNPSDYIIGFMAGNDVSARDWQTQDAAGGQHHVAKSFDHFAPVGPILASYEAIGDPETLDLETLVNGEMRQRGNTSDFLFSVRDIMINLTRGKTLRKGTMVMTGTPSGVAAFMKPPAWLKDGDEVEVRITGLGSLRNKHVFHA